MFSKKYQSPAPPSRYVGYTPIVLILSVLSSFSSIAQENIGTITSPEVSPVPPFSGCWYYEHSDYKGKRADLPEGIILKYVGDRWNDRISSYSCSQNCDFIVWEHRDMNGRSATFPRYASSYVGDDWNDIISSARASCRSMPLDSWFSEVWLRNGGGWYRAGYYRLKGATLTGIYSINNKTFPITGNLVGRDLYKLHIGSPNPNCYSEVTITYDYSQRHFQGESRNFCNRVAYAPTFEIIIKRSKTF